VPVVVVAVLFLAAAGLGLAAILSSSKPHSSDQQASLPSTFPTVPGPTNPAPTVPSVPSVPNTPLPTTPSVPATPAVPPAPSTPTTPSQTAPTNPATLPPAPTARPVSWLGMQIETVPPGAAVVDSVKLGSVADRAGVNPGDIILAINGRSISGAGQIARAVQGLPAGQLVPVQISHGSTLVQTDLKLGAPPSGP
jgi:membrane-associated protease RseP (regulator of RpoE activity)